MSVDYNEFQAGQGVSAAAMNQNFSKTNDALNSLEVSLNTSVSMLNTNIGLKADKNGSTSEAFNVADATESAHSVNLNVLKQYVPAGSVIWSACPSTPSGYLLCDGRAVSRTTYSELFNAIGTTFGGGDGSTTFNLPTLTDNRFIRGASSPGSYQNSNIASHAHSYTNSYFSQMYMVETTSLAYSGFAGQNTSVGAATAAAGSGSETYPKNVSLLPCIKY